MGCWFINDVFPTNKKSSLIRLLFLKRLLDIVLPQAGEKRSHPSADLQVINGVPNADYRHLMAVGFALLDRFSATCDVGVNLRILSRPSGYI
ncbi:hypothetical protein VC33_17240 [Pseudomonas fluorescens]|nr:hypothetical protein VC33_17240 [Pseudomonas fluorescens]